jgi:hypothetical protein
MSLLINQQNNNLTSFKRLYKRLIKFGENMGVFSWELAII